MLGDSLNIDYSNLDEQNMSLSNKSVDISSSNSFRSVCSMNFVIKLEELGDSFVQRKYISFFMDLENEIRKIYLHNSKLERDLYVKVNQLLHIKDDFAYFSLEEKKNFMKSIFRIISRIHFATQSIDLNITAFRLILLEFDKDFCNKSRISSFLFLRRHLSNPRSDLSFLLQMKVVS